MMRVHFSPFASLLVLVVAVAVMCPCGADHHRDDEVHASLTRAFQQALDSQAETTALWIGLYDPLLEQDMYFALGRQTGDGVVLYNATLDEHFDIGSVTKTVAGTAVLMLVQDGVLALNDTVQDLMGDNALFVDDFPLLANYTVEQLLRMQTRIPDIEDDTDVLFEGDPSRRFDDITTLVNVTMRRYPVAKGMYSSTNYLLLELLVDTILLAQTNSSSLRQVVQERILAPLGMNSTVFPPLNSDGVRPDPAATPIAGPTCASNFHDYGFVNVQPGDNVTEISRIIPFAGASGSMVSNIYDFLAWTKTAVGDTLLDLDTVTMRRQYDTPLENGAILYGMAQFVYAPAVLPQVPFMQGWYGHNGGTYGFATAAYVNYDELNGAAMAFATNDCGTNIEFNLFSIYTENLKARMMMEAAPTASPTVASTTSAPDTTGTTDSPPTVSPVTMAPSGPPTEQPTTSNGGRKGGNHSTLLRMFSALAVGSLALI